MLTGVVVILKKMFSLNSLMSITLYVSFPSPPLKKIVHICLKCYFMVLFSNEDKEKKAPINEAIF